MTGSAPEARREHLLVPTAAAPRPEGERTVLEKVLAHFLVDLSIALHRLAMYPAGHPSLAPAIESLARDADGLLQDRPRFAVGVARDRLVIEGVVTDDRHPLLRALAERLHRHRLSALSFSRGVTFDELTAVVTSIAEDPDRGGRTLGEAPDAGQASWPHITLHPLRVEDLQILEAGEGCGDGLGRSTSLWLALARAAVGRAGNEPAPSLAAEPAVVAHAIEDHQRVEAYDQVIVGYLLQIAEEARDVHGPETLELRRRVSALVSALHPETLRRLLAMGGSEHQRFEFLHNAAAGLRAGAVVDLVKAAAQASDESVSNGLVRILTKLAAHAEAGSQVVRPLADGALRLQVERLLDEWQLPDSAPSDHLDLLRRIAQSARPAPGGFRAGDRVEPLQIVQLCLELSEDGPALWRALDATVASTGLADLAAFLESPADGGGLLARVRSRLVSADTVRTLVACDPPDFASLDLLLPHLTGEALGPLFDVLVESGDRRLRRAVFDRLRRTGDAGFSEAVARLGDGRGGPWYVIRNLLALVAEIESPPAPLDATPWLGDGDPRVRREALRVAARDRRLRERAVCQGLSDGDERVLRAALAEALAAPTPAIISCLRDLSRREPLDDDVRAGAITALGRVAPDRPTLDVLVAIASRAPRLLRGPALAPKSRALLAALSALAAHWPADPAAAAVLRRAARCGDRDIQDAAAVPGR